MMRDRLIELLRVPIYPKEGADPAEVVADYLLDSGVIMPPCKVGDTVYLVTPGGKIHEKAVLGSTTAVGKNLYDEIWMKTSFVCESALVFKDYDVGKTVFLTREEAEQALKEVKA